jgi:hypothetical protein
VICLPNNSISGGNDEVVCAACKVRDELIDRGSSGGDSGSRWALMAFEASRFSRAPGDMGALMSAGFDLVCMVAPAVAMGDLLRACDAEHAMEQLLGKGGAELVSRQALEDCFRILSTEALRIGVAANSGDACTHVQCSPMVVPRGADEGERSWEAYQDRMARGGLEQLCAYAQTLGLQLGIINDHSRVVLLSSAHSLELHYGTESGSKKEDRREEWEEERGQECLEVWGEEEQEEWGEECELDEEEGAVGV